MNRIVLPVAFFSLLVGLGGVVTGIVAVAQEDSLKSTLKANCETNHERWVKRTANLRADIDNLEGDKTRLNAEIAYSRHRIATFSTNSQANNAALNKELIGEEQSLVTVKLDSIRKKNANIEAKRQYIAADVEPNCRQFAVGTGTSAAT